MYKIKHNQKCISSPHSFSWNSKEPFANLKSLEIQVWKSYFKILKLQAYFEEN